MSFSMTFTPLQSEPRLDSNDGHWLCGAPFPPLTWATGRAVPNPALEHTNPLAHHWHGLNRDEPNLPKEDSLQAVAKPNDAALPQEVRTMEEKQTKERRGNTASADIGMCCLNSTTGKTRHTRDYDKQGSHMTKAVAKSRWRRSTRSGQKEHRLERNRQASERWRQRKKVYEADLERYARELEYNNARLNVYAHWLQGEVLNLKTECLKHTNCDCGQ